MSKPARLSLKKGKEKPLLQHHHWIYSGAIDSVEGKEAGDLLEVYSSKEERIGLAFYNPDHSIAAHMIAFGDLSLEKAVQEKIERAISFRKKLFEPKETNAFRLINAEGDGLPGLIADAYNGAIVLQISHPGMEKIKDLIVQLLVELFRPRAIFEKSTSFLRKKGGLSDLKQHLYGERDSQAEIVENGMKFFVDLLGGQKTGFFLDQREMRSFVKGAAKGKRVLNCFGYTGGFSIAALLGGASHVETVEASEKCREIYEKNLWLNGLSKAPFQAMDVFDFLKKKELAYDLILLDPPAFVKKRNDVPKAFRAYKEMNRQVIAHAEPNTLLVTSSCSYHVDEPLFQNILFRAAFEANRSVKIVGKHRQALDHPVSIYHPESAYLKSLILLVE